MNQSKNEEWIDERGRRVPAAYVKKCDKFAEVSTEKLLKEAVSLNKKLTAFKEKIIKDTTEFIEKKAISFGGKKPSENGNYDMYNFDRSIKVSVAISNIIKYDSVLAQMAKEKFDEYMNSEFGETKVYFKNMVIEAFSVTNGKLDPGKVGVLTASKRDNPDPLFQEAVALIEQAEIRSYSATYHRIYTRNDDGSYQLIDLNFSSI